MKKITKAYLKELSYEITGAAIEVHRVMGPGLLESLYEQCMILELALRGIKVESQKSVPAVYKGTTLEVGLRYDLFVENCIVTELKAVNDWHPIFDAKGITYAKLLKAPKVILINFNCTNIWKEGQKSFVTEYYRNLPEE